MDRKSDQVKPLKIISVTDAVAFCIGIVIGVGVFKTPPLVAANTGSEVLFLSAWLLGGVATLAGMLCYAELASAHPNAGGEYHFLRLAYGHRVAILFAWARCSVIQTGAIAAVAFVFGDYAQQVVPLGRYGPTLWAVASIIILTCVNLIGTPPGKKIQIAFSAATVALVIVVIAAGFLSHETKAVAPSQTPSGAFGLAMVFVLLTYGGWNEVAYLSGEMKDVSRGMLMTALIGTGVITLLYVTINLSYYHVFGLEGVVKSQAIGADFMRYIAGDTGATILSLVIGCAALSTLNASIFTGARVYYALGNDLPVVRRLGVWSEYGDNPRNAFLLQAAISLVLVIFGGLTRDGFSAMVDYTAPIFWLFLLLTALSLFILRFRKTQQAGTFKVPLYPITPLFFVLICAYLFYASLTYTGTGALIGLGTLLVGLPFAVLATSDQGGSPIPVKEED